MVLLTLPASGGQATAFVPLLLPPSLLLLTLFPALFPHALPFTKTTNNRCYFCSFIKMAVTLVKYIPQVALNHSRQSTEGWSIDNVLLDLSGGLLSVAQVLISCQVLSDWKAVTGGCWLNINQAGRGVRV